MSGIRDAQPYRIDVAQAVLDDLRARLARVRWPDEVAGADWEYGTDPAYLRELVTYWHDRFDWRAQETALNRFPHFRATVAGVGLHFIRARGQGPRPLPLLLTHGWPDSFLRMVKLIPLLTDPAAHGGDPADAFDVIVPSIPGFGFSDRPTMPGVGPARIADLFAALVTDTLRYARFGAHGGDWGSTITEQLARRHPEGLAGIHLTDIPPAHLFSLPAEELTNAEQEYLRRGQGWRMAEGAYALIQGTKPQTLGYGLADSPVGLAAWLVEKFRAWSDCDGDVERRFSKDELLSNITLYWATNTINSANRLYYESRQGPTLGNDRVGVPTGVAIFSKDIIPAPRAFGERFFNIQRWTELPRGGHFAALEEPELLAGELRTFFHPLR